MFAEGLRGCTCSGMHNIQYSKPISPFSGHMHVMWLHPVMLVACCDSEWNATIERSDAVDSDRISC